MDLALGLVQITIVAAVGSLIWVIKKWRKESEHWTLEKAELTAQLDLAGRTQRLTEQERDGLRDLLTKQADLSTQAVVIELQERLRSVEEVAKSQAAEFWSRPLCRQLPVNLGAHLKDYGSSLAKSIPIVLLANQKGGVGKTTTAANLAAAWAARGKRVLVVDLDYQGSFTHLARYQVDDQRPGSPSHVSHWLASDKPIDFSNTILQITPRLHYVSCGYSFESHERQLEYSWILGNELNDIRYRLASVLQLDFIQQNFDCVVLDAPPRLTTGFINGFAAATHLYVPTVVDRLSVTAVLNFAKTFVKLAPAVNPQIKLAGVVGTMTWVPRLAKNVKPVAAQVNQHLRTILGTDETYFIERAVIKRDPAITQCLGIAYFKNENVRSMFDELADIISPRVFVRKSNGQIASASRSQPADLFPVELR